jgi:hypothetical protein
MCAINCAFLISAGSLDAGQLKEKVLGISVKNGDAYMSGRIEGKGSGLLAP